MTAVDERWQNAQRLEREFHCVGPASDRRRGELSKRLFIAGVLGVASRRAEASPSRSVLDIGCGPESIALLFPDELERITALDPLVFDDEDEDRYVDAGVERIVSPAEDFRPWTADGWRPWDEVWIYNCLQHTRDPLAVLDVAKRCARRAVRVFEYVHVPTDDLHLHVLTPEFLRGSFRGWNPAREVTGTWRQNGSADFYSALFLHRSEDALSW